MKSEFNISSCGITGESRQDYYPSKLTVKKWRSYIAQMESAALEVQPQMA